MCEPPLLSKTDAEIFSPQRISHNRKADSVLGAYRSEAKTVPNLLVAPVSPTVESKKEELYADYPQGYYSDGAYTAIPHPQSISRQKPTTGAQQEDQDKDAQEAYYASLAARFTALSEILKTSPPRSAPSTTDVYYLEWKGRRLWLGKLLYTAPTMVLLAHLTQESVLCGIRAVGSLLIPKHLNGERSKIIGAWAWGLLGRCREVGQMSSEEVGVLRKVGKQAVWLLRRISAGEIIGGGKDEVDADVGEEDGEGEDGEEEEGEEEEEDGDGDGDGEKHSVEDGADSTDILDADDGYSPSIDPILPSTLRQNGNSNAHPPATVPDTDIEKAKQRLLSTLTNSKTQPDSTDTNANNEDGVRSPKPASPLTEMRTDGGGHETDSVVDIKSTIHATLDMLVTVIGEFYGQRDLLDGRLLWDEM